MMTSSSTGNDLTFSSPARYRISVKGFLDESWSERFGDMRISNQVSGTVSPMAVLVGPVVDQTELVGVLNSLYEMHLPLVSVEIIGKV
jgi:hypothetical protein